MAPRTMAGKDGLLRRAFGLGRRSDGGGGEVVGFGVIYLGGDSYWENQAYIRQWIGELLLTRGEARAGLSLLVAALDKWTIISPPKARLLSQFIVNKFEAERSAWPTAAVAEKFTLRWISKATRATSN
jgi:hypothetical protein